MKRRIIIERHRETEPARNTLTLKVQDRNAVQQPVCVREGKREREREREGAS